MAETNAHLSEEALFLWVAGELEAPAAAELEGHVGRCPECARRLEREAQLEVAMHQVGASMAQRAPVVRPRRLAPASERARLRRENPGIVGRLKVLLVEAPKPVRSTVAAAASLVLLGGLGLGAWALTRTRTEPGPVHVDESHATFTISESKSKDVYGYGDDFGVTKQARNELHFVFEVAESIPVVYYLTFEPQGVDRAKEVDISLNGVHVGYVAPTLGDYTKVQRFKLPKKLLRKGVVNELVLDHADNPPNAVSWAIAKARLIIRPLPSCEADECLREAKKLYDLAVELLEKKDIAAENRFRAWTALHQSLLFLENLESDKPDLYTLANSTLRELDKDLQGVCNKILMTAKRYEEMKDPKKALYEYKNGLAWFPESDDEHPCRGKLKDKIADYGDAAAP